MQTDHFDSEHAFSVLSSRVWELLQDKKQNPNKRRLSIANLVLGTHKFCLREFVVTHVHCHMTTSSYFTAVHKPIVVHASLITSLTCLLTATSTLTACSYQLQKHLKSLIENTINKSQIRNAEFSDHKHLS